MTSLVGLITSPLSDTASVLIGIINIILIFVSVFIGLWTAVRLKGKLKTAIIFLILAMAVILTREVLILAEVTTVSYIVGLMRTITVLFILFTVLSIKKVISVIDNKHKK